VSRLNCGGCHVDRSDSEDAWGDRSSFQRLAWNPRIGAIAHPEGIKNKPVLADDPIDEASCNRRDRCLPASTGPPPGIQVGELLVVEDFL
jgi:hypothetical protein